MPLLPMFKPQEEPCELIFPRKGPLDTCPQGMDGCIEAPLPPSLRGFGKGFADVGVVQCRLALGVFGYRHALPLHPRITHPSLQALVPLCSSCKGPV
jgi:hypothetical protein